MAYGLWIGTKLVTLNHDLQWRNAVMAVTFVKSLLDFKANCVKVVEGRPIVSRCVKMWPSETSFGQYIELALGLGMDEPQCIILRNGGPPDWRTHIQ